MPVDPASRMRNELSIVRHVYTMKQYHVYIYVYFGKADHFIVRSEDRWRKIIRHTDVPSGG